MSLYPCRLVSLRVFGVRVCPALLLLGIASAVSSAQEESRFALSGDLRLRFEQDWDSQTASGAERTDRARGRVRFRVNAGYAFSDDWSGGLRVRSGSTHSQQSPHLTFATDDGARDDLEFVFDRYFLSYAGESTPAWVGRNNLPFWQQNELFWDDDVTPTGVAVSHRMTMNGGSITAAVGGFALPDGGYRLNGSMVSGQVVYRSAAPAAPFTVAVGLHRLAGEAGAHDLRNRNGERDYLIGVASAQWQVWGGERPLVFGADLFENFESYTSADAAPLPAGNADETTGWVLSASYGRLKERGDWQAAYYYAHIETFAVNASYAQDDWVRFGSGGQTDSSDFSGHEFRFTYAFSPRLNAMARLYLVDAISTVQDGKRFRMDLNWKF